MKSLLTGLALLVGAAVFLPSTASANPRLHFQGRCGGCGVPTYAQRAVVGYDSCGRPVFRSIPVRHVCRGRQFHPSHFRGGFQSPGYGFHPSYGFRRGGRCDNRRRGGFSISIFR